MKVKTEILQHPDDRSFYSVLAPLYCPLSSPNRTVHYYIIISLHMKVNYIMYAIHMRNYCRDSISQLRQGKLQSQLINQRSLTGTRKLSKPSSFLKCFPGSTLNKCSSSPNPIAPPEAGLTAQPVPTPFPVLSFTGISTSLRLLCAKSHRAHAVLWALYSS